MSSIYAGMRDSALAASKARARRPRGRGPAIALAIVTLVCALLGVAYNVTTLAHVLGGSGDAAAEAYELTHFRAAFYVMSAVCLACYAALVLGGWRLLRGHSNAAVLLVCVWLFEVVYFACVAAAWFLPGIGASIAGATGVANGGLMYQFALFLPVWGPLVALWFRYRQASPAASP
jgi:hypothetical protein